MRFRKHIFIILLVALTLTSISALAQEDKFTSGIIKTDGGVLLVWNEPKNYYTLEIKGERILPASTERTIFIVDHKFLQILTVATNSFIVDEKALKQADEKIILTSHRNWEAQRIESTLKEKLNVKSSWQKLSNGKEALLWEYDMQAKAGRDVKKQIYMSVLKGDFVLMLNGAVTEKASESVVRQMLIDTLSTLKSSKKPIDFQKMQETIKRGEL
jgi:hypothetical protein